MIHEAYTHGHIMPPRVARKRGETDADGYASLPQGTGPGVEMHEAKMAEVNADPARGLDWSSAVKPYGSIRDYWPPRERCARARPVWAG